MSQDRLLDGNHESTSTRNKKQNRSSRNISTKSDSTSILSNSWKIVNSTEKLNVHGIDLTKTPIQVKILYETNSDKQSATINPKLNIEYTGLTHTKCNINENCTSNDSLIKGQTLLTSFFRRIEEKSNENLIDGGNDDTKHIDFDNHHVDDDDDEYDNPLEIDYAPTNELIPSDCEKTERKCMQLHRKRIRRKYKRISTVRQRAVDLLVRLVKTIRKHFTTNGHRFRNKNVLFVYQCLLLYHRFTREFVKQSKSSETPTATTTLNQHKLKMTTEAITINRRVQKLLNDHTNTKDASDDAAVVTTVTTPNHTDGGAKRPPKSQRSSDNSRLLLLTENAHESSEKDFGMYFDEARQGYPSSGMRQLKKIKLF